MKSILILGLVLANLTAYSQHSEGFSHKDLGLGYRSIRNTSSLETQRVASPRDLLNEDASHRAMVRKFAERFSGQDSVVLTSSILDNFAATRKEAAGVHLFLGNDNGKLQVIIAHTKIDTLKVNSTFAHVDDARSYDSASNYNVVYDRAYYWNNQMRNWRLVEDQGALKLSVLTSRDQAENQYGYKIQGYYLSKDLLLKIRRESGQDSLTVFLGQEDDIFHLIIPILPKASSAARALHYATDYEKTPISHHAVSFDPPPKDHNTIRPCPPYCSN